MQRSKGVVLLALGAALAVTVSACGSAGSSGGGSGGALPSVVSLPVISELSGPAGVAGLEIQKGYQLAAKDINSSKLLGEHTIELTFDDTGNKVATGASLASKAVTKNAPIVFGSPVGTVALAEAPIFARANQPTIFNEAGSNGVLVNKYIYRLTPTIPSYYSKTLEYLKSQNIKTLAIVTNSDQPTLTQMAEEARNDAAKYGYTVASYDSVVSTQADVASTVSKMVSNQPDAVALDVQTGQNATFVKGLADAGYKGLVTATTSAGGGVLNTIGAAGNGVVWSTNYTYQQAGDLNAKFVKEYNDAYGKNPTNWAASAYDSMFFAARSLKEAGSTNNDKMQAAMQKIGAEGFEGVLGKVVVKDNQQQAVSTLAKWQDGQTVPL